VASAARLLRIGEAATRVGVSPSALRQWEHQGLVAPTRSGARYRLYSEADIARLVEIRRMRTEERVNAPGIRRLLGGEARSGPREAIVDGSALRDLRRAHGLSLKQASERAGLSVSSISAVERGAARASVATLQRLTSAYDLTVGALLSRKRGRRVVRAGERIALELPEDGVRIEQLADGATQLEPHLFSLAPGASSVGDYRHEGEEFVFVITGSVTIGVGEDEQHRLLAGDALTFPSTLPHRWHNNPREETRLLWINTPPTF
jgi:DNA-binding transcriptional MerR regulator